MTAPGLRPRVKASGPPWDKLSPELPFEKLQASSQRFARLMGRLIAKYNKPFERDNLVHITTLTYQTPEGLRVWGGSIVKPDIFWNIQASLEEEIYTDVKRSGFDESLVQINGKISLKDDSFRSLPEKYLDQKYTAQVDMILEDDYPKTIMFESFSRRKAPKLPMILSTRDNPKALLGCHGNGPGKDSGIPVKPKSDCLDTTVADMPPNQSLLAWIAKRGSTLGDTSFQDKDSVQDLTISDIYAEMLWSLTKCLPSQKVGCISTKKSLSKSWFPKVSGLNITVTMESTFIKVSQKLQVIPGEENSGIGRKLYKQNLLPCSEPDTIVKDSRPVNAVSSPLALKGSLPNHTPQKSPSRTKDVRHVTPSPSSNHRRFQTQEKPDLCLPPALISAKKRFHSLQKDTPGRDVLGQERQERSKSLVMPRMFQTPKNVPVSQERLYQKHSASSASGTGSKTGFPRDKVTKARKSLPFSMKPKPCKAQDKINSMFGTYFGSTQWAEELIRLKKSGHKSEEPTQNKVMSSLETLGPCDDPQEPRKAAFPCNLTRSSPYETVSTLHWRASARAASKGDFSSPTKRRKVSSSQTWDHFNPSKMRDKK